MKKIVLKKVGKFYHTPCQFCSGDIITEIEIDEGQSDIKIKGNCRICDSYVFIHTHRRNAVIC